MRRSVMILLSSAIVMALGGVLVINRAAATGMGATVGPRESEVVFSASPRFPVAREEADLALRISRNGAPETGLSVTVVLTRVVGDDHDDESKDMNTPGKDKDQAMKAPDTHGEAEAATKSMGAK